MSDLQKPEELTEPDIALNKNAVRLHLNKDFFISMYSEASSAYFKGVEIGISTVRLYFFTDAVLITGFFTIWKVYLDNTDADFLPFFMLVVCSSGMLFSGLVFSLLSGYSKQLSNCLASAKNIEVEFLSRPENIGLFSQIEKTAKRKFDSLIGLRILFGAFFLYWIISVLLMPSLE